MRHVKRRLPTAAALLTVLVVAALPVVALAQSAGDQQYSDPLAGNHSAKKTTAATPTTGPSATKAPPVSLPSTTTTPSSTSSSSSSSSTSTSTNTLPRTGLDEWKLVALAAALLLAGVGLRLRTAGVRRR
jgi:hypothetical protein